MVSDIVSVLLDDCQTQFCRADLDDDGNVDTTDLLALLAAWGDCPVKGECSADLNGDGTIGILDLLALLANWDLCP